MPTIKELLEGHGVTEEDLNRILEGNKSDKLAWLDRNLLIFWKKLQEVGNEIPHDLQEVVEARRLVRINTYIDWYKMDFYKAEYVCISGLFMVVDGYFIPSKLMHDTFWPASGSPKLPESMGLPSCSEAYYPTSKNLGGCYFVLKRNWLSDHVYGQDYWDYLMPEDLECSEVSHSY